MATTPLARCSVLAVLFLSLSSSAFAQLDTGTIVGTVTDTSSAVLPGVTITITQEGTDVALTTVTNASGQFTFPGLRVGRYTVAAELQGFRRGVRTDVIAERAGPPRAWTSSLEVGTVSEQIVVSGRTELLQTQSADIGSVVDERQVRDLPLLGRRYAELALLVARRGRRAGGHHEPRRGHVLQRQRQLRDLEQLHARRRRQQFDVHEPAGAQPAGGGAAGRRAAGVQGPDAHLFGGVRQGRRRRHQRVGQAGHAISSAARCSSSSATSRSTPTRGTTIAPACEKGPFNQHIAGGVLGGPLVRRRTFFFGDYQAQRTERALSQTATVPTARMRAGDLSELTGTMVASNPFVPAGCVDAANKTISPGCIDPVARQLIALYPLPNVPGAGFFSNNFISNGILNNDVDQFDIRVDHTLRRDGDQLFGRYSFQNTDRHEPPILERSGGVRRFRQRHLQSRPELRRRDGRESSARRYSTSSASRGTR